MLKISEELAQQLPEPRYERVSLRYIRTPKFQRPLIASQVARIARNFSWPLFGTALLWREGTTLWTIDAQQRIEALRTLGDENVLIPALVYDNITYEQAAKIYRDINAPGNKRALTPGDLLKAEVEAKEQWALDLNARVIALGLELDYDLSKSTKSASAIRAVAAVRRVYRSGGPDHFSRVLRVLRDAFPEDHATFNQHMIKGMHLFLMRFGDDVLDDEVVNKLRGFTVDGIQKKAASWAQVVNGDKSSYTGRAIHDAYNSGKKGRRIAPWDMKG